VLLQQAQGGQFANFIVQPRILQFSFQHIKQIALKISSYFNLFTMHLNSDIIVTLFWPCLQKGNVAILR